MRSDKIYRFRKNKLHEVQKIITDWHSTKGGTEIDYDILQNPDWVEAVPGTKKLETPDYVSLKPFSVGKQIVSAFNQKDPERYLDDKELWNWLTLFFLTNIQNYKILSDINYYLPAGEYNYQRWYKHMIRQTVIVYKRFGKDSEILMPAYLGATTDMMEWTISTPWMQQSNYIRVANLLYKDPDSESGLKVGSASRTHKGWIKHFNWYLKRLRFTLNTEDLKAEEIFNILSQDKVFENFIN